MTVSTLTPPSVQCPQCGSHSIVECRPTVYHCLKCDFEKDLSVSPEPEDVGLGSVILGLLSGLSLMLILL